jgi:uncharacterized protein
VGANGEVVRGAYTAFAQGDIATILGMLGDTVEWSAPGTLPQGGRFEGRDGVQRFFEGVGAAWETLAIEAEVIDEVGANQVVGVVRGTGKLRRGGVASYGAAHVFDLRDGKITRFREFVDIDQAITA